MAYQADGASWYGVALPDSPNPTLPWHFMVISKEHK
jgi:hypothetical protein